MLPGRSTSSLNERNIVDIPVFDFNNPWVALIQLALTYLLPRLTGLISDRLAKPGLKMLALGVLTIITSALTFLLDVAVAQTWATLDWVAFINVIVNAAITFGLAQAIYKGVIVPLGQNEKDADNGISLIPADPQRELEAAQAHSEAAQETLARRIATAEAVATRVATAVVEEKLAAVKTASRKTATTAKAATPVATK
jgi:hypothetical protein